MTDLDGLVLATLRARPHHDTLPLLLDLLPAPVDGDAVAESLERLQRAGMLITADGHWQLTAMGWRQQRAA
jgi:hypothetical protein